MRAIATKQPTNDSAKQKKNGDKGRSRSVSPLSTGMPLLQRKCACGGGCPRCQDELGIQTKLKIGEPGDKYEQQADRIADQVMGMPEPSQQETSPRASLGISSSPIVERQVEGETEQENLSRPSSFCRQEGDRCLDRGCSQFGRICEPIQPGTMKGCKCVPTSAPASQSSILQRQAPNRDQPSEVPPIVHEVLNSSGQPLDLETRRFMESRFGHSFSAVKVHADTKAGESAQAVNALAYTVRQDIAFAPNTYQPNTPTGLHLLAHELAHVVQQEGASAQLQPSQNISSADDLMEHEADRAADAILRGEFVYPSRLGSSRVSRLQRAVSKVCNPPSVWFLLGGPQNLFAAQTFGAIAETFISADVIARNGVTLGNFYFDNPLAGPIDPVLVAFIIAKNPGMSWVHQLALGAAAVARPDVLMHQGFLTEFEEVKPNSVAGRAAGRAKTRFLSSFYPSLSLPYTAGTTYIPHPPFVIVSGSIGSVPIVITFETTRDRNGLLVYDICVETDWLLVSLAAIAIVIAIILILLTRGRIIPVPMPQPLPA